MVPLCLYCWKCVRLFLNKEFNCSLQLELNVLCFLEAWFLRWKGMSWDTAETLSSLHLCIFSPSESSVWGSPHIAEYGSQRTCLDFIFFSTLKRTGSLWGKGKRTMRFFIDRESISSYNETTMKIWIHAMSHFFKESFCDG